MIFDMSCTLALSSAYNRVVVLIISMFYKLVVIRTVIGGFTDIHGYIIPLTSTPFFIFLIMSVGAVIN